MATTVSGAWSAVLSSGQTIYVSGDRTVNGPIEITGSDSTLTISSGATVSGLTNPSSAVSDKYVSVTVLSGGKLESSTLNEVVTYISSGGSIDNVDYTYGPTSANGGTISDTTYKNFSLIATGDTVAQNLTFLSGAYGIFEGGASINGGVVAGSSAGEASRITASSGGIVKNVVFSSGAVEFLQDSGTIATGNSILADASATVSSYATDISGTVAGSEAVGNGGNSPGRSAVASETMVASGGIVNVRGGGVTSGATVLSGGTENVVNDYNATAVDTVVSSGGRLNVASNGTTSNTIVSSGGIGILSQGATETVINGQGEGLVTSGGLIAVRQGGRIEREEIHSGTSASGYLGVAGSGSSTAEAVDTVLYSGTHADVGYDYIGGDQYGSGGIYGTELMSGSIVYVYGLGSSYEAAIESGAEQALISSGAIARSTNISSGGLSTLAAGTQEIAAGVAGIQRVGAGGNSPVRSAEASKSQVFSGGVIQVQGGGVTSGTTIYGGGVENVLNDYNAQAYDTTVSSGGALNVDRYGSAVNVVLSSGGREYVASGATNSGLQILSGGVGVAQAAGVLGDVSLASGGMIDLNYFDFGSAATATIDTSNNVMTVRNGGATTTVQLVGNYIDNNQPDTVLLTRDDDGSTIAQLACYLAGTHIRTPVGPRCVEDLEIGQPVETFDRKTGQAVSAPIVWIGRKRMKVHAELPVEDAGYPIRIMRNAIADGVPCRDLLVTPEHCMFMNDSFIPARMLVNCRSIYYDLSFAEYEYFHIETEDHAIIWAEDALSETFLDTGNRTGFSQPGVLAKISVRQKCWETDAIAPLNVGREHVEPIFHALDERATRLNMVRKGRERERTSDPDLRLLLDNGREIRPVRQVEDRFIFMIPHHVQHVHLLSRASRPSTAIGPFVDDRRTLGVLVGEIMLFDSSRTHRITTHHENPDLAGWSAIETPSMRWTTGCADLLLDHERTLDIGMLSIQVVSHSCYLLEEEIVDQRLAVWNR